MDGSWICGACIVCPALTAIVGALVYGSVTRAAVLAASSFLGVLAGIGGWLVVGGYIIGGGPLSVLLYPVAIVFGWAAGTATAVLAFTQTDRLAKSHPADPPR